MKVELCISKNRVSYIIEALGKDKVNVSDHDDDMDFISFETENPLDFLYMFHAGIKFGSDSMSGALRK